MLNLFRKKEEEGIEELTVKIEGMHCSSCSMNIDGELEDLEGVSSASTSYAKQVSKISYNPEKTSRKEIEKVISGLGYSVK